ncbi:MAG: tetraacyldisaccharide 4'-kinase [Bosea sp. (in: a-proteobacteria)]
MRAPDFWWQDRPSLLAHMLSRLGALYGAITAQRMAQPGTDAGLPVICIGNMVVGGQGKTPVVAALARQLLAQGQRPFALARGYGGRLTGPLRVDPALHTAHDVGDEPRLLADILPVIVSADRVAGARLAKEQGATHVLMDDGLQNPSLTKSLRLAVVDGMSGFGNGLCLPAGPLRAPASQQWPHVDALVLIGAGEAGRRAAQLAQSAGKAVLTARLVPDDAVAASLAGQSVLALSGIGRPEKFEATLATTGAKIVASQRFGDHHAYSANDIANVMASAKTHAAQIVTTEKDWTKLAALWPTAERARVTVLPVTLAFDAPDALASLLGMLRDVRRA